MKAKLIISLIFRYIFSNAEILLSLIQECGNMKKFTFLVKEREVV